jgi:coenzyme F420-dependent glucose-6-phosphate dehydrogenase
MTAPSHPVVGFHCSHEQHPPSTLLELARRAERAGFDAGMCSDHFYPWSDRQGQAGFTWSWLGAALASTSLSFGTVNAPGQRYHPAIVAQAAATLAEMYPDRFWLAVGSGEALNEHITGQPWPSKADRNARLRECVDVMRALWAGETVTSDGHVRVERARLYTRPAAPPPVFGAALTPETARWLGAWADGLITIAGEPEDMRKIVDAFRETAGPDKPMFLQVALAYGRTDEESARIAYHQWRQAGLSTTTLAEVSTPWEFDEATRDVSIDEVAANVRCSAEIERHLEWLRGDLELGFARLYLHNVVPDHDRFFEACGERLLPALKETAFASRRA